jgi:hypothetical protein
MNNLILMSEYRSVEQFLNRPSSNRIARQQCWTHPISHIMELQVSYFRVVSVLRSLTRTASELHLATVVLRIRRETGWWARLLSWTHQCMKLSIKSDPPTNRHNSNDSSKARITIAPSIRFERHSIRYCINNIVLQYCGKQNPEIYMGVACLSSYKLRQQATFEKNEHVHSFLKCRSDIVSRSNRIDASIVIQHSWVSADGEVGRMGHPV